MAHIIGIIVGERLRNLEMALCYMERILQPIRGSRFAAQSAGNARMHILCGAGGAKKQLKAARKSLEVKQKEVQEITESLRTGASFTSPHRLAAVIESLQVRHCGSASSCDFQARNCRLLYFLVAAGR